MTPLASRRANILNNLQRQLLTILTANGYAHSVMDVSFRVRPWSEIPQAETPLLYIVDDTTTLIYGPTKTLEWSWSVDLYGIIKGQDQGYMEEFMADVVTCLFKNVTLTFADDNRTEPLISHMRVRNMITDGQLFSEIENSNLFKINLDIKYMGCVDNYR